MTTLLEIQLIKAEPYVELTYTPVHDIAEALTTMDRVTNDPTSDFVDGACDAMLCLIRPDETTLTAHIILFQASNTA